ncbi:hypothetical protein V6N11_024055 [Hibiscus sabdariffa]|uniref:Uncharacterized protein n=1 Tax=Hibiscus sabdariffa TaxID=183260 RepID=A0ABR2TP08_9ROSI
MSGLCRCRKGEWSWLLSCASGLHWGSGLAVENRHGNVGRDRDVGSLSVWFYGISRKKGMEGNGEKQGREIIGWKEEEEYVTHRPTSNHT